MVIHRHFKAISALEDLLKSLIDELRNNFLNVICMEANSLPRICLGNILK
jgi:hypothetical protein